MAHAGPRREQQQDARAVLGRDGAPFVGAEHAQRAGMGLDGLASGVDARVPFDDEDIRVLLDLMVTERLSRLEDDEDRPGRILRVEYDRRAAAAFDLNLVEVPAPHERRMLTVPIWARVEPAAPRPRRARTVTAARLDSAAMSLSVDRYELGPVGTNCYIVRTAPDAAEAVVIDPGGDADTLERELAAKGASCVAILITHGHWDHLGGVADLAEAAGAPVYMAATERIALEQIEDFAPAELTLRAYTPDVVLDGNETLELAGITFQTLLVPGHSPAHLAYYADGCLFSGDVLFAGSVGRTDIPFGDWETLIESIRTLEDRFPPETVVYSGHGPETTLGAELARNPFLAELRTS